MKYKTPVSLVLAALALLMLDALLPSVAADGQSTQVKKGRSYPRSRCRSGFKMH